MEPRGGHVSGALAVDPTGLPEADAFGDCVPSSEPASSVLPLSCYCNRSRQPQGQFDRLTTGPAGSFAGSISLRKETYQEEVGIGEILVGRSREIIGPAKTGSREGTSMFTPTTVPRQRVVHYGLNYPVRFSFGRNL